MKKPNQMFALGFALLVSGLVLGPALSARAEGKVEGKKVILKNAPAGVQKTVADQLKGGMLKELLVEVEDGKTEYEASILVEGRSKTLTMDDKGKLLESEVAMELTALPEAVRNAITQEAGKAKIESVGEVTRDGVVTYEATVKERGKEREIVVGADGKVVPPKK